MAVSNNYEIKTYTLDGVAVQFAIPFDVNVDDYGNAINIVVYLGLDELEKDVDYTITIKTINYPDAVSHTGEKLTVFRRTPIEQPVDFVDNGNFTLEDIETGLDRSIMIEQETSANLDNTVRAQESAEKAEQYKDIAIEKASDAEDWAVGTRSDGETPSHSLESSKHYAEAADTSASMATSMRNQSAANALVSEGYAKGTQGGVPVESGDYYQDNSKYYKEQAGLSAGAASGSATSAYNSELAAAASENKAHDWADKATDSEVEPGEYSAKHWASKASQSSGSAAVSAYNAGLSETAADTSAKDSEAWAVGQRGGSDVDPTDPTYHNNSKYYADQIASQTVTPDNIVTLTNKTISYADNTLTGVVGESATQTLTNKTIDGADNTIYEYKPSIGVPTLWMGTKPDWALDFGNGASTKYLWANYPKLNTAYFKDILDHFKTTGGSGLCADYDAEGFYVPDLRGMMPRAVGTNGKGYSTDAISNVGAVRAERLPNITGQLVQWFLAPDGVAVVQGDNSLFKMHTSQSIQKIASAGTNATNNRVISFNAGAYNSIYQDNAHVSPLSFGAMYVVRYE